jgi:hypothetical protein
MEEVLAAMKKKTLIIFIVLLAVVFLATSVYAGGKKSKHSKRWWKGSFHYVWKAVSDLQDRVEKLEEDANEPQGGPAPTVTILCPRCDFYDLSLADKDLSGAYLAGAYMYYVDLTATNLSGADLSGAYLYGATVTDTNFVNANLIGADFTGAVLSGCIWGSTICPDGTNTDDNGGSCMNHLN